LSVSIVPMRLAAHGLAVARLNEQVFGTRGDAPSGPAPSEGVLSRLLRPKADRLLDKLRDDTSAGWVAQMSSGEILGAVLLTTHPTRRDTLLLGNLAVADHARRLGLGGGLLKAALAGARAAGASRVALQVDHDNAAAIRIYERADFRRLGEVGWYVCAAGAESVRLKMCRSATPADAAALTRWLSFAWPDALSYADVVDMRDLASGKWQIGQMAEGRQTGAAKLTGSPSGERWLTLVLDPRATTDEGAALVSAMLERDAAVALRARVGLHMPALARALTRAGFRLERQMLHMAYDVARVS
jgi:ribosomal protein S18 acetylase RimI-like enzyme